MASAVASGGAGNGSAAASAAASATVVAKVFCDGDIYQTVIDSLRREQKSTTEKTGFRLEGAPGILYDVNLPGELPIDYMFKIEFFDKNDLKTVLGKIKIMKGAGKLNYQITNIEGKPFTKQYLDAAEALVTVTGHTLENKVANSVAARKRRSRRSRRKSRKQTRRVYRR